jgi:hypothetical protein
MLDEQTQSTDVSGAREMASVCLSVATRLTSPTGPRTPFENQRVLGGVGMSAHTVSPAFTSGGLLSDASAKVLAMGDEFKVGRIAARTIATKVVKFVARTTGWYGRNKPSVGQAVRHGVPVLPVHPSVTTAPAVSRPNPTACAIPLGRIGNNDSLKQSSDSFQREVFYGKIIVSHDMSLLDRFKLRLDPFGCVSTRSGRFVF